MSLVLPEVPSFGAALARGLGSGISSGIGSAVDIAAKLRMKQLEQQNLFNQVKSFMAPQGKEGAEDLTEKPSKGKAKGPSILDVPDEAIDLLELNKDTRGLAKSMRTRKDKAVAEQQSKSAIQRSYSSMVDLTPEIGFAVGPPDISLTKGAQRAEFEEYTASLAGAVRELFNKGLLTNQKFEYIMKNLPHHGDRESIKVGKLRGLGKELGLDTSELDRLFPREGKKEAGSSQGEPMVKMRAPDGSEAEVPKSNVKKAMEKGAVVIR